MTYPSLPTADLLSNTTTTRSESASSVDPEPVTPELPVRSAPAPAPASAKNPADAAAATGKADGGDEELRCKWGECKHTADSPDELYDHLCTVHVGRKSTNNLCLTCGWEGCGVQCVKRDHITSHLRVHTPLKPHPCSVCAKTFKRPQDLKKHERIHTTEHHQLHKLSKAPTSVDPAFNSRVGGGMPRTDARPRSPLSTSLSPDSSSSHSLHSSSPFDHLLAAPGFHGDKSVSPTPSVLALLHRKQHEELAAYQQREMLVLQQLAYNQQQSQAYAARLAAEPFAKVGMKRGQGDADGLEGLLADMKKRKVEPIYDQDMIQRLNSLVPPSLPAGFPAIPSLGQHTNHFSNSALGGFTGYPNFGGMYPTAPAQQQQQQLPTPNFPIPDIRTEADLAMFNEFMISLGRDAAGGNAQPPAMAHTQSGSGSGTSASASASNSASGTGSPLSEQSAIDDLFNSEDLAQLGLSGMPGIPIPGMTDHQTHAPSHAHPHSHAHAAHSLPSGSPSISFGGLYPQLDGMRHRTGSAPDVSMAQDGRRPIAGLPRASTGNISAGAGMQGQGQGKQSYLSGMYGLGPNQYPDMSFNTSPSDYSMTPDANTGANGQYSFDSLARAKQSFPTATLAPKDFYKKTYRHVQPLGAAVASRSRESAERTGLDEEDEEEEVDGEEEGGRGYRHDHTPKIPVRSLLIPSGNSPESDDLTLPAISPSHVAPDGTSLPPLYEIGHYRRGSSMSSSSASASASGPASGAATPRGSPGPQIGRAQGAVPVKRHTEDEIVRGVKRLELGGGESIEVDSDSPLASSTPAPADDTEEDRPLTPAQAASALRDMRRRHAALIKSWLVAVNLEFRRRRLEELQMQRARLDEEVREAGEEEEGVAERQVEVTA
ncbi:hypothetical protein IAT38_000923 [Cryptococcus sp. DSM 104549]